MKMIVGLTGGMGSGKTTVGRMFKELGVPVYNSDVEARRLMQEDPRIHEEIVALFGKGAYDNNLPNRSYIASRVFGNQELLDQLNAIIHPAVADDFKRWAASQQVPYVIQEAAVIFENGSYPKFDKIILVTAPQESRIERIRERDGSSRKDIVARMEHQWEDSRKAELSDFIIINTNLEKTRSQVRDIHQQLLKIPG